MPCEHEISVMMYAKQGKLGPEMCPLCLRAENERLRTSLRNVCKLINVSGYVDAEELAALNEAKAILTETKG